MDWEIDYKAKIKNEGSKFTYYVQFIDSNKHEQTIEVTEAVFLQFFGVHKREVTNDQVIHYIVASDGTYSRRKQVTKDELKQFNSFKQQNKHIDYQNKRYHINKELSDEQIYYLTVNNDTSIVDLIAAKDLRNELYKAINELKEVQKRRLIMYFFNCMTYEQIAIKEGCTKRAVKFSVDIAIDNLKKKMGKK
jgi:hypothetical protein